MSEYEPPDLTSPEAFYYVYHIWLKGNPKPVVHLAGVNYILAGLPKSDFLGFSTGFVRVDEIVEIKVSINPNWRKTATPRLPDEDQPPIKR